jgi:predicted RecB family endonuclease
VTRAERDRLRADAEERIKLGCYAPELRPNIVLPATEVVALCDALDAAEEAEARHVREWVDSIRNQEEKRDEAARRCEALENKLEVAERALASLHERVEYQSRVDFGGWTLPAGQHAIINVPGGHLSVVHTDSLRAWAREIGAALARLRGADE